MTKHSFSGHPPQLRALSWFLQMPESGLLTHGSVKNFIKKYSKRNMEAYYLFL